MRQDEVRPAPREEPTGLGWPVKASFVRYVAALVDGRVRAVDGATIDGSWGFVFPPSSVDFAQDSGSGRLRFSGGARFRGHLGMLALDLLRPVLALHGGTGTLQVDGGASGETIADVAFSYQNDDVRARWLVHTVAVTQAGASLFGDAYASGDLLAPMAVSLPCRAA